MTEFLTARFPGTGGRIKESPEDFQVEEIPLYPACGEGEHLYLEVEKSGLTTFDALQRLAHVLGVPEREMGYAGLKDERALTRQFISVPGIRPEQAQGLELEGMRILSVRRHRNKLRLGHLAGNRFRIRIRDVVPGALERALDSLHVLEGIGVPNRFGLQRYGALGNSHLVGRAILRGDYKEAARQVVGDPETILNERWRLAAEAFRQERWQAALQELPPRFGSERRLIQDLLAGKTWQDAVLRLPRKLLRLYLSACQSSLFDRVVAMRLASLETLWPGDLAYRHDNGACFRVEDPVLEQERADRFEISPSGPMFGYKMTMASGPTGVLEESLMDKEKITLRAFRIGRGLSMEGERRPLRVPVREMDIRQDGNDLLLSFSLPRGSYATCVLQEIMKS